MWYDLPMKKKFEVGRLDKDSAIWISKMIDLELGEFWGTVIFVPPVLMTGAEIYISLKCYLTRRAFVLAKDLKPTSYSAPNSRMMMATKNETDEEVIQKSRKKAVNALFKVLALKPVCTNNLVGPREFLDDDFVNDSIETTTLSEKSKTGAEENNTNGDDEEPVQVSDKELDVLYEKAQKHGRDLDPMDPPSTMTYTLKEYQRHALAWMYSKEQLSHDNEQQTEQDGQGSGIRNKALHPLWEEYEFVTEDGQEDRSMDEKRFYMNPYTGELSLEFPSSEQACRGGILADEMGLGKTIEILSLIHSNRQDSSKDLADETFRKLTTNAGPFSISQKRKAGNSIGCGRPSKTTLIVCPMSLLSQWRDEAVKSSDGSLRIEVYYGSSRDWDDNKLRQMDAPDILITSYGTLMSEYSNLVGDDDKKKTKLADIGQDWKRGSALFNVDFHRVVLDEAHQIKSRITKTSKACYAISAARRWTVTGTPIQNKLEDLFSLVHFLGAEPWSNFSFWRTFITIPFESDQKDKAMKVITSVLEPLVLRRTKETKDERGQSIVNLPPKHIEIEYLNFSDAENDIYQALFKDGKTKFNTYCSAGTVLKHYASIFQLLMRMRQVCDHPLLVVGRHKIAPSNLAGGNGSNNLATDNPLRDGPLQLDALLARFTNGTNGSDPNSTSVSSGDGSNGVKTFGENVIESLMNRTGQEVMECPICFEDMSDGVLMPCMHLGCRSCVLDYLQRRDDQGEKGECPICRAGPITENDLLEYTTRDSFGNHDNNSNNNSKDDDSNNDKRDDSGSKQTLSIRRNVFKSSTKLDALLRHLQQIRKTDSTSRSVVFSQFTLMLDLTETILDREGISFLRLDGTHSQSSRANTLRSFQDTTNNVRVLLISLRAGGVGLNLTAANYVFMLDPWWNFAIEAQAIDRVHRIGQIKPVVVKRFIVRDSVEEKILAIQSRKNALASGLGMTKEESQGARMEDLQEMFS